MDLTEVRLHVLTKINVGGKWQHLGQCFGKFLLEFCKYSNRAQTRDLYFYRIRVVQYFLSIILLLFVLSISSEFI